MSTRPVKRPQVAKQNHIRDRNAANQDMPANPLDSMAVSSSLDSIRVSPRTPKTARPSHFDPNGHAESEEIGLSLLGEEERRRAAEGLEELEEDEFGGRLQSKQPLSSKDKRSMALLCVLCKYYVIPFRDFDLTTTQIYTTRPHPRSTRE